MTLLLSAAALPQRLLPQHDSITITQFWLKSDVLFEVKVQQTSSTGTAAWGTIAGI
jgi:hypothetical protein